MIKITAGKQTFGVRGERRQWVLGKISTDAEGKESIIADSYFTSTAGLIKALLELKVRLSDASTLTELQQNIKKANDELSGLYDLTPGSES